MFTVAKAILEVLTVLQELNVILVIIVLGTAAVKWAHKRSRHKIFSDFREIKSVQRSAWTAAFRRVRGLVPIEYTRICILHFVSGIS